MSEHSIDGGALFATSLRLVRRNALLLTGLPFVINLGLSVLSAVISGMLGSPGVASQLLFPPLVSGVVTLVAADILAGSRIELRSHLQRIGKVFAPLVALSIVATIATVLGLFALIVPGLYIVAVMLPLIPVIVFEKEGWGSIARAYDMSQPVAWHLVGLVLRLVVLAAVTLLPLMLIHGNLLEANTSAPLLLLSGLMLFVSTTIASIHSVAGLLVYHQLR